MPTSAQIKNDNNTLIRAKTVAKSITKSNIANQLDAAIDYTDQQNLLNAPKESPTFTGTVLGITKTMVGLSNVDNTSDVNKPISTATQTALDLKEDKSNKSINITTDGTSDAKYPSVKAVKTYVDANAGGAPKTSGSIDLSATPQVLPYDINSCSFSGGIAYLPTTNIISREIYVIATANNISIRANVANTAKMFTTFGTFTSNIVLTTNQMYRFIYIGFDVEGYWKAELI